MTVASTESEQRLQHSPEGLRRLTQIEEAQIHIYLEGKNGDRYYYAKILEETISCSNLKVDFHLSREISGPGEGKSKCLHFHEFLAEKQQLFSRLEGKRTVNCFILDKDIDELTGAIRQCFHIIYTKHYCVENHIVTESVVSDALAAAIGMDARSVSGEIGDQLAWLASCCECWKEWVALCVVAKVGACGIKNFGVQSQVNRSVDTPADEALVQVFIEELAVKLAIPTDQVMDRYKEALATFHHFQSVGQQDQLFKGKWYAAFLGEVGRRLGCSVDEKAIWAALSAQVRTAHPNQETFKTGMKHLIAICNSEAH